MKIKQLFTSFLACMALWSAPVYAKDYAYDVQDQYLNLFKTMIGIASLKNGVASLKKPTKQGHVNAYESFLQKYSDFLNKLDELLKKGNLRSVRKARTMLRNLMEKNEITNIHPGIYTNTIGITNADVKTLKTGLRYKEENLNKMKELYKKMKNTEKEMQENLETLKTSTQSEES